MQSVGLRCISRSLCTYKTHIKQRPCQGKVCVEMSLRRAMLYTYSNGAGNLQTLSSPSRGMRLHQTSLPAYSGCSNRKLSPMCFPVKQQQVLATRNNIPPRIGPQMRWTAQNESHHVPYLHFIATTYARDTLCESLSLHQYSNRDEEYKPIALSQQR